MKLYQDYKKQFKWFIVIGILLIPMFFSFAQTVSELNSKINQKENDIEKLEREILKYQSELEDLSKQKSSLDTEIRQLDLTRKKLNADISVTSSKIDKTNLRIQELGFQIGDKESSISNNIEAIKLDLRRTSELEVTPIAEQILSEKSLTEVWNDLDQMLFVRERIIESIDALRESKNVLEDTRQETTKAKNELLSLKAKLADQKKIVDQNTSEKKKLLTQTKSSESNYQKLVKERLAQKMAFEKELRDYESQLKYILDPNILPGRGVLSWPLDSIKITQMFGKTSDSGRLYASGSHSGTDFRAPVGTPVKSMAEGTVIGVGNTDATCVGTSFGKFIVIKYNNGLASTYAHLSLMKVVEGEKVARGQVVGYSGNTGYSTGPHLHVSVYAPNAVKIESKPSGACYGRTYRMPIAPTNAYLDPLYYLPPL